MQVTILAGRFGIHISEDIANRPKPMIRIDGRPIRWHAMKTCSSHGIHDVVIRCGCMSYVIKGCFANDLLHTIAFQHTGFWHPVDTLHNKTLLEDKWTNGTTPRKNW